MFKCECGGVHFRHAGYMELMVPFVKPTKEADTTASAQAVRVCVKCRRAYVWYDKQMYDVTKLIDLQAWEKAEHELHAATGPGGEC